MPWESETRHGATFSRSSYFSHGRPGPFTLQGYGIWLAASAYQRRPGPTGRFGQDRKTMRGTAAQREAYKPVAEGGIVAVELSAPGSN